MKLLLVEFLDLWERSPTWRNSIIAGLVGLIMVFFALQSGQKIAPPPPPPPSPPKLVLPDPDTTLIPGPNPGPPPVVGPNKVQVKKIDPQKKPKKAPISLDTEVGEYTPEPQLKKPRRNPNAREAPIPLDTPVGEFTSKPSSGQAVTPQTNTQARKPAIPLESSAEQ